MTPRREVVSRLKLGATSIRGHTPESSSDRAVIPPRRDAKIIRHGNSAGPRLARDEDLRRIRRIGRKAVEGGVGIPRAVAGRDGDIPHEDDLRGRLQSAPLQQATAVEIRCRALNMMTHRGMLDTVRVVA